MRLPRTIALALSVLSLAAASALSVSACSGAQKSAEVKAGLDTVACVLDSQGQGLTAEQLALKCGLAEVGDVVRIVSAAERAAKRGFMVLPDAGL